MSLIDGTTQGDSNSLDGEETEFTGEERRSDGVLFGDAPNWIHFELIDQYIGESTLSEILSKKVSVKFKSKSTISLLG